VQGLSGQVVAVTGAAGGIGSATCRRLEEEGARVFALDLRAGAHGEHLEVDVTDAASLEAAVAHIVATAGRLDGMVAGAGIVEDDVPAEQMSVEQFDSILAVNLRGVFLSCTTAGRVMLQQGAGRIVAISSMSGNHTVNTPQKQCAYNASKAGVSALVRSLAVEWADRGVRVNAVAPGYIGTDLLAAKKHQFPHWLTRTPQSRFGSGDDVAAAIAFLLSDESGYFCGSELLLDGGYTLV
jgi:NAD(P)-dependent dehydrogenase (short-subunit alcohol dehydrogenase family)